MDLLPDWTNLPVVGGEEVKRVLAEYERTERGNWAKRFEGARANIPEHFAWIEPLKLRSTKPMQFDPFYDAWRERMPWFTNEHAARLWYHWKTRTNLLICGPPDVGKTCMLVLHAQWTFALASYDATEVRTTREALASWAPSHRLDAPPREPAWLPQVREAQGLLFMFAADLLDDKQQGPNESKLRAAIAATALYIDDVGREMSRAQGSGHVATSRRAAMMRVIEKRWANERRFVATSEHTPDELGEFYGNGSFRRIAGERSGATVIDLAEEQWAGPWLRQQKAKTNGRDR